MDQDQPRADASATIDPATIAGSQTHPSDNDSTLPNNDSLDSSIPNDSTNPSDNPLIPSNDSIDSPVPSTNDSDSTSVPTSDSPTNPLVSSSTPTYTPISPSSDSLDSPSVLVSPDSTNSGSTPSDSYSEVKPRQYTDIKPVGPTNAIVSQSKSTIRDKAFKFNKTAVIATVAALSVIVAVGIGSLVLTSSNGNNASISGNNKPITTTYKPQTLALGNISGYNQLLTGKNQNLKVNGQLSVSNSIVLSPTTTPTSPTLGQLYYNSSTNTPYLYNGKSFISLIPSVGGTIAGASTSLSLGNGLGLQGSNLVSTGVTSLSGTPGQIIASASNGSIKLSLPSNLTIAGNFTTTNGLVTNNLEADYITGNGYGITDINPNALPSTLAYQNKNNTFTAPQKFKNSTDSTDSFSIQDAAGNTLLSADTTDNTLTVSNLLPETAFSQTPGSTINQIIADSGNEGYNDNGQWSVMGSDGLMRFVYTNWTTDTIHYVRCENTSCTTYIDQPIETDATNGLDSPTIALDKNGDAYIAYIDYTSPTNSWHIAHCSDENCSTTTIEDLTQTNPYGYNGSIAVDGQDHADLVYDTYDYSVSPQLYSLEFIHCDNTDCSSNTDTTLASSNSNNGGDYYETSSVVTAPDGYPRVAYVNGTEDSLVYDNCSGSYDCSSYSSNVVDNGNAYYWMSMAIGSDGLAKFVYEDEITGNALEYAACNDAACSTATKTQLVSGTDSYGGYGSIALTANNLPVISSYTEPDDSPPANLLYIYCSDADCTSPLTKTVGSLGTRGYTSNIGITGNGLPMITYIYQDNGSDASIDSVTLGDITGASITSGTDIGSSSDPFGTIYANSIQTSNVNSGSDGQLLVQGSADASNAFTVQDASGNNLLNVNSLTDTTTLSTTAPITLGPNLITVTDFTNSSYWWGSNWTMTPTTATYTGSGNDELGTAQFNVIAGALYKISFTVSGDTNGGCIVPQIGDDRPYAFCQDGTYTTNITANDNDWLGFFPDTTPFNGTISNVSVQQVITNDVLVVDTASGGTGLSVDSGGILTLNDLSSNNGSTAICLNSSSQVAQCTGSGNSINNSTSTQDNANFNIQSASPGDIGGVIQGASGQTADLLDLDNNNGDVLDSFNANGDLQIGGANSTNSTTAFQVQDANDNSILAVNSSSDTVTVANAPNNTGYALNVGGSNIMPPINITPVGISGNTWYEYKIIGLDSAGQPIGPQIGGYSGNSNGTLSGTNYNQLSWTAIPSAASYDVYRQSDGGGGSSVLVGTTTATSLNDTGQGISSPGGTPSRALATLSFGSFGTSGIVQDISGNYLYVYENNSFAIVNITGPSSPTIASTTSLSGAEGLRVEGNYLYAVTSNTLNIYNVADEANPTLLTTVTLLGGTTQVEGMAFNGNYLYLLASNGTNSSVQIFNISVPGSTFLANSVPNIAIINGVMAIDGNYLYAAGNSSGNDFYEFNISNPLAVTQTTSLSTAYGGGNQFNVYNSMLSANGYIYIDANNSLEIINVNNPISLQIMSRYSPSAIVGASGAFYDLSTNMAINGQTIYIDMNDYNPGGMDGTAAIDVSSPSSPSLEGYVGVSDEHVYTGTIISNGIAYITTLWPSSLLQVFPLGGTYTTSLTAGDTQIGSLSVSGNENIVANSSIQGSLTVGQSIQDVGSALFQDSSNSATAFQVQNSAGANLLNVDTANNLIRLGSTSYSTGTISQSTNTVTGSGTTFTSGMVGGTLIYSDGTSAIITGYTNSTTITVSVSKTVSSGSTYQIQYSGLSVSASGAVLLQTSTNSTTAFQIQNSSGQALLTADTTDMVITITGTLTLNGHLTTGNSSGNTTAAVQTDAGSTATCTVTGNDTSGKISIASSGSGQAAGAVCVINFSSAFSVSPNPVIEATSSNDASVTPYLTPNTSEFTINFGSAPSAGQSYTFDYFNAQ